MKPEKTDVIGKEAQERETPYQWAAGMIRKRSEAGKLVLSEEIFQTLREKNVPEPGKGGPSEEGLESIIKEMMERNEDLKEIPGHDGLPRYYSGQVMSDAYARLLVRKEGNPLLLIAETVRENSKVYPRPIRMDTFKNEPFDLTEEEISTCLQKMKEEDQYKDIAQTTTSEGTVFLYSTLHLEPDYASMLAEWVDVGQYRNP
ncbi:MAG: hypothetical protein A2170_01075 [Deltaproteobacteria bacterium RBG_13_53_10]|nr:MAG: hypothetical protein A2170_01075 [Deltaproteobacteria bacterium RBG_13_53_10]